MNASGSNNTFMGYEAGLGGEGSNSGSNRIRYQSNTVSGYQALKSFTTATQNVAVGWWFYI